MKHLQSMIYNTCVCVCFVRYNFRDNKIILFNVFPKICSLFAGKYFGSVHFKYVEYIVIHFKQYNILLFNVTLYFLSLNVHMKLEMIV